MSLMRDEQGNRSTARLLIIWWLVVVSPAVLLGDMLGKAPSDNTYPFLGGVAFGLAAWAGGPRVAQYLGGIATAFIDKLKGRTNQEAT